MESIKYRQVNWQDGMKLNRGHFIHFDNFHIEQHTLNRNLLLNENNFGVLPSMDKTKYSYEVKLSLDGDFLVITKFRIAALMLNGMYINVDTEDVRANNIDSDSLKLRFKYNEHTEKQFALVLKINSYKGIECGKFDSEDFPLKRPYLMPFFEFILSPINKLKESYFSDDFFIIAKFDIENNQLSLNNEYIPPVTSLISTKLLSEFHSQVLSTFNSIENHLLEISKKHSKNKGNNYSETLVLLSNSLIINLSSFKFEIKHNSLHEPPIELILKIKSFANVFSKILETRTSIGKDGFLNEVIRIIGTSKNEFEELVKQITNLEYRHHNISDSISLTRKFLSTILQVFKSLSEGEQKQKNKQFDLKIKR
jgi:hypothetical protein